MAFTGTHTAGWAIALVFRSRRPSPDDNNDPGLDPRGGGYRPLFT